MKIERNEKRLPLSCGFLMGAVILGGSACGGPVDASQASDSQGQAPQIERSVAASTSQAGPYLQGEWEDDSGTVHVRMWRHDWVEGQHPEARCPVPSGWVLVGGGAETFDNADGGGILTASYPDGAAQQWVAKSKDHGTYYPHWIRAYCVGLKLDGVTADNLRAQTEYMEVTSTGTTHWPSATLEVPSNYVMVGGGARTNWSGAGVLLYESLGIAWDEGGGVWYANARDFIWTDYGSVTAFAIAIPTEPLGYGGTLSSHTLQFTGSPNGGGYQGITASQVWPWAMTAAGAATWAINGFGRLLTDAFLTVGGESQGGSQVWSKDHFYASSGHANTTLIGIRGQ